MSMSNLILININIMDMKRHTLICFFISMLVGKERGEIVIRTKYSCFFYFYINLSILGIYQSVPLST
jgi:hypothetical protein